MFSLENTDKPSGYEAIGGYAVSSLSTQPSAIGKLVSHELLGQLENRERMAWLYFQLYSCSNFFEMDALGKKMFLK